MSCPFCTIPETETHRMLFEGENVVAILANPRMMPGHTLVVPKKHVEKISELNKEERDEIVETIIDFKKKITNKIASGCDIRRHYHPYESKEGRHMEHLHIHLYPRSSEDEFGKKVEPHHREIINELEDEEREKMMDVLGEGSRE